MSKPRSRSSVAELPLRPPELEDWLNAHLYHPLAARLAVRLAHTPVTPDMVSVGGACAIVLAALAYGQLAGPWGALMGLALHMSWHVLDGADGDLARLTGRASSHGELVDGICDYVGHIVLYFTMGGMAAAQIGPLAWVLMWAAGASRVAQQAHYEGTRRQYQLAVYGTPWMASVAPQRNAKGQRHPFVVYYMWLTGLIVPHGAELIAAAHDPSRSDALREGMRARGGQWLGLISPLSSNYRTLGIGAAMLAGSPHWYFVFEILVLGCVLAVSLVRVRRVFRAALAHAETPPSTRR